MKIKMPKKVPWGGLAMLGSVLVMLLQYKDQQETIKEAVKEAKADK